MGQYLGLFYGRWWSFRKRRWDQLSFWAQNMLGELFLQKSIVGVYKKIWLGDTCVFLIPHCLFHMYPIELCLGSLCFLGDRNTWRNYKCCVYSQKQFHYREEMATVWPAGLSTPAVTVGSRIHLFCKHRLGGLELMISPNLVSPENRSDFECQK